MNTHCLRVGWQRCGTQHMTSFRAAPSALITFLFPQIVMSSHRVRVEGAFPPLALDRDGERDLFAR